MSKSCVVLLLNDIRKNLVFQLQASVFLCFYPAINNEKLSKGILVFSERLCVWVPSPFLSLTSEHWMGYMSAPNFIHITVLSNHSSRDKREGLSDIQTLGGKCFSKDRPMAIVQVHNTSFPWGPLRPRSDTPSDVTRRSTTSSLC